MVNTSLIGTNNSTTSTVDGLVLPCHFRSYEHSTSGLCFIHIFIHPPYVRAYCVLVPVLCELKGAWYARQTLWLSPMRGLQGNEEEQLNESNDTHSV